jgi:hypothetical protein
MTEGNDVKINIPEGSFKLCKVPPNGITAGNPHLSAKTNYSRRDLRDFYFNGELLLVF